MFLSNANVSPTSSPTEDKVVVTFAYCKVVALMSIDRSRLHRISAHAVIGEQLAALLSHEGDYPQTLLYWSCLVFALNQYNDRRILLIHNFLHCLLARLPPLGGAKRNWYSCSLSIRIVALISVACCVVFAVCVSNVALGISFETRSSVNSAM